MNFIFKWSKNLMMCTKDIIISYLLSEFTQNWRSSFRSYTRPEKIFRSQQNSALKVPLVWALNHSMQAINIDMEHSMLLMKALILFRVILHFEEEKIVRWKSILSWPSLPVIYWLVCLILTASLTWNGFRICLVPCSKWVQLFLL